MTAVYSVMWFIIAGFLLSLGLREQKIYMVFSIYFVFNGIWWGIAFFTKADMFHGTMGWIFRGITAIFLVIGVVYYYFYKKNNREE